MTRYDTVLLDADNTLFDFDAAEDKALRCVLAARGYSTSPEVMTVYSDINTALWSAYARGEVTLDHLLVERFRRFEDAMGGCHDPTVFNDDYLRALATHSDLMPGALDLCRHLAGLGRTLAIVTNGASIAQRDRYAVSPIRAYIPHLFISQELGVGKPDPLFFDLVCRKLGISDRSRTVVVGDNLASDILGGYQAGIDTIWYNPRGAPLDGPVRPTYTAVDLKMAEMIICDDI